MHLFDFPQAQSLKGLSSTPYRHPDMGHCDVCSKRRRVQFDRDLHVHTCSRRCARLFQRIVNQAS